MAFSHKYIQFFLIDDPHSLHSKMTYFVNADTLANYQLGEKIYERPDGSYLCMATGTKEGGNYLIRARKVSDEKSTTMFENEKAAYRSPAKLRPYCLPLLSVFQENGFNYCVFKNESLNTLDQVCSNSSFIFADEDQQKHFVTQFLLFYKKLSKLGLYPIENLAVDNVFKNDKAQLNFTGFENVIPSLDAVKGLATEVTKIAEGAIGLKTNFLQQGNFIHFLFTNFTNAITENGLNILTDKISNQDALNLINECVSKTADELKDYNPFKSKYLEHQPTVECSTDHISVDQLTLSWSEGISVALNDLALTVNPESASVSVKHGDNGITISAEGVKLEGEVQHLYGGTSVSSVTIGPEGVKMEDFQNETTINAEGLTSTSRDGTLTINAEGVKFEGSAGNLTIGSAFECTMVDFKPSFSNGFSLVSPIISTNVTKESFSLTLNRTLTIEILPKPSIVINSNGTSLRINDKCPLSVMIGDNLEFDVIGKSLQITLGGVSIVFENGELTVDNDEISLTVNKQGPKFLVYGVPFDLSAYKDQLTCPSFEFAPPDIQLPEIPGLPPIPKPDIGGCCNIY